MTLFIQKNISQYTLGERLRRERESANLSVREVSDAIKVQLNYIEALEAGNYAALPSELYIKAFLKSYARYIGLDVDFTMRLYQDEFKAFQKHFGKERNKVLLKKRRIHSVVLPRVAKSIIIMVLIGAVFGYLGIQLSHAVNPPNLHITEPFDNLVVQEYSIRVMGATEPESKVTINGQEIAVGKNGEFEEDVSLHDGLNTIEISATKGRSRSSTVYKQVVVDHSVQPL